jgi:uncharacterized cupin superfamily protein
MVVRPGEGALVAGLGMTHKVDGATLGGRLLVVEGVIAPGTLVTPHTHSREDECSFILEGQLTYLLGDAVCSVGPGCYVPKPRGVRHAFWNACEEPARVLEMHTPATFDTYYDELGAVFQAQTGRPEDMRAAVDDLAARFGLTMHWDDVPTLAERYGAPVR